MTEHQADADELARALHRLISVHGRGDFRASLSPAQSSNAVTLSVAVSPQGKANRRSAMAVSLERKLSGPSGTELLFACCVLSADAVAGVWSCRSVAEAARAIIGSVLTERLCEVLDSSGSKPEDAGFERASFKGQIGDGFLSVETSGGPPVLVESERAGFNIVHYRRCYFAIPLGLGKVDLQNLPEYALNTLHSDFDLAALRARIDAIALQPPSADAG